MNNYYRWYLIFVYFKFSFITIIDSHKNDEYFNELTQDLSEEAKSYLQAVYYLEILRQSPPFDNKSETPE